MSGCADICLSHDYDGDNAFYSERHVKKSRKPHKCCECGEVLPVGSSYIAHSGKADGEMWSEDSCLLCDEIRKAFVCGSFCLGELWESIRESMFPVWRKSGAWDCLAKLTTEAAVAKCNAEYAEWLGDWDHDEPEVRP